MVAYRWWTNQNADSKYIVRTAQYRMAQFPHGQLNEPSGEIIQ